MRRLPEERHCLRPCAALHGAARKAIAGLTRLAQGLLLALVVPLAALAQAWESHDLGEASFEAPGDWQIISEIREQDVTLLSPDGRITLMAFWWIADEPLLGWDDEVETAAIRIAGRPATFVHRLSGNWRTMLAVLDEPRAEDGYRLLFNISGEGVPAEELRQLLTAILDRVSLDGAEAVPLPDGPVVIPPIPGAGAAPAPGGGAAADEAIFDPAAGLGLILPAGWSLYTADQPGARLLTLLSPDLGAMMIVARSPGAAEAEATENLFFSQWVVPRSIEADTEAVVAGFSGSVIEIVARVYSPGGVRLGFDKARVQVFRGRDGQGAGLLVATLRPEGNAAADARLAMMMAAVTRDAAPALAADGLPVAEATAATASPFADPAGLAVWSPMLTAIFEGGCQLADPAWYAAGPGAVFAGHGGATADWALQCMDGQLAVFGMDFRYDMRGPTGDYFTPLFIDLSDALGGAPFVVIETSDLAIAIVENGEDGLSISQDELPDPRAYAAAMGIGLPETAAPETAPPEPAAPEPAPEPAPAPEVAAAPEPAPAPEVAAADLPYDPDRPVPEGELFTGLPDPNWLPFAADGGSFDDFARVEGGALVIDVPEKNAWGTTGIRSAGRMLAGPRDGALQRVVFGVDPARTSLAFLSFVPPGDAGKVDRDFADYRLGIDLTDPAAPAVKLWLDGSKEAALNLPLPSAEAAREVTMELYPDGLVRVLAAAGSVRGDAVFEGRLQSGYVLYAVADAPKRSAAVRAAITRIAISTHPWDTGPSHDDFLYGPENATLLVGQGPGPHFRTFRPRGMDRPGTVVNRDGAQRVEMPAGKGAAELGIFSLEPVVWLDRLENGGSTRVVLELLPEDTTGLVVALSGARSEVGFTPGSPAWFMHWRRQADGTGKLSVWHRTDSDLAEAVTAATLPDQIALVIREGRVEVEGEGLPDLGTPWETAASGQGLRLFVYARPDQPEEAVSMAVSRIYVSRTPGAMPDAGPAPGVDPLPQRVLFEGAPGGPWKELSLAGGDFATGARHDGGWLLLDTDGSIRDAAIGLRSTEPVAVLDHRVERTPFRIALTIDPATSTGIQLYISPGAEDNMPKSNEGMVSFLRAADGIHAGEWRLTLAYGHWPTWSRWVDDRWLKDNWNGQIVLRLGKRWASVVLPSRDGPGLELRGNGFSTDYEKAFYLSVLSLGDGKMRPAHLALGRIEAGWETPAGMTAMDRFGLVDDAAFDVDAFLAAAAAEAESLPPETDETPKETDE